MTFYKLIAATIIFLNITAAQAQSLEQRVRFLENKLRSVETRLDALENGSDPLPGLPPEKVDVACLVVDSGYAKTFLGMGRNSIEAEDQARQFCSESVNSSYCTRPARCSSGEKEVGIRGYICSMKDSGYNRPFRGDGKTSIEAEAKAKQACQQAVNSQYCGNVTARCEPY